MEKQKYHVNIASGEISRNKVGNNSSFVIYATEDEVYQLRDQLDEMHHAGVRSFFRAHIPIKPYSEDQPNDEYDSSMLNAYQLIHDLGDEEAKAHVAGMNILNGQAERE